MDNKNSKISKYGYLRVKAVSPLMKLGHVKYNVEQIVSECKKAQIEQVSIAVFPEMSLCGYTIDDLVHQQYLLENVRSGLKKLLEDTKYIDLYIAVGLPYQMPDGRLYNTGVVLHKGKILGMTLKQYLPNYSEFYDMRYFVSGLNRSYDVEFNGQKFYAGNQVYIIKDSNEKILGSFGVEICEDLFAVQTPATLLAQAGASIILNLSASNELVGKHDYRRNLISQTSSRLVSAYVYASSGPHESVKDLIFSGSTLIYENGSKLAEGKRFLIDEAGGCTADIDLQKLAKDRRQNMTFGMTNMNEQVRQNVTVHNPSTESLNRVYHKNPFIPSEDPQVLAERCEEIFDMLATGLAREMQGMGAKFLVMGLSGGMDSTTGALIAVRALKKLGKPSTCLHTISMPGFGTSDRTRNQSKDLAKALNTSFFEISIEAEVTQHLKDINQPEGLFDATYENAQARARTKLLLNWANQSHVGQYKGSDSDVQSSKDYGLQLNNSSLSEVSQGWSTSFGDACGNFNCLGTLPKSLEKVLLKYEMIHEKHLENVLSRILDTPISPELLPTTDKSKITQLSQNVVGDYDLIDFILYHQIRNGFSKNKIKMLIKHSYKGSKFSETELLKTVDNYFKRFYANQFKRSSNVPPAIKIGIDLNPRGSWRCPDLCSYEDDLED